MPQDTSPRQRQRGIFYSKDNETVKKALIEQFGYAPNLMYEIRRNRKVYAYKPCSFDPGIRMDRGLYFGRMESNGIRLSIEGSFLVGPRATKNVLELDEERAKRYLAGESIQIDTELEGWIILKWGSYYLGTGRIKWGRVYNYIPKERRLMFK